jgi:hypothetical protein
VIDCYPHGRGLRAFFVRYDSGASMRPPCRWRRLLAAPIVPAATAPPGALGRLAVARSGVRALGEGIDTSTPAGRLVAGVVGSIASFERARIQEHIHGPGGPRKGERLSGDAARRSRQRRPSLHSASGVRRQERLEVDGGASVAAGLTTVWDKPLKCSAYRPRRFSSDIRAIAPPAQGMVTLAE